MQGVYGGNFGWQWVVCLQQQRHFVFVVVNTPNGRGSMCVACLYTMGCTHCIVVDV